MKDPLELENRRRIHQEVTLNPGLHYRELQRRLDMVPGLLDYHLAYLQEKGLMIQKVPEQLERVDAVPRNPTGKILKHELRERFAPPR